MFEYLENCWEIKKCGRQKNGWLSKELGECIASRENMGHSCWVIAGTLCGGTVQGDSIDKGKNCIKCEVYKKYNRTIGSEGDKVKENYPDEEEKYKELVLARMTKSAVG